jgi:hypothetical protein
MRGIVGKERIGKETDGCPLTTDTCLGWIYYAHPSSGECFYLWLLLTAVKGMGHFKCFHMKLFSLLS